MQLMNPSRPAPPTVPITEMSKYSNSINNITNDSLFINEQMDDVQNRLMNFGDKIGVNYSNSEEWDLDDLLASGNSPNAPSSTTAYTDLPSGIITSQNPLFASNSNGDRSSDINDFDISKFLNE